MKNTAPRQTNMVTVALCALCIGFAFLCTGCPQPTTCTSDADCTGGQVCNTTTGQCETPTGVCTSDADCAEGEFCDTGTGECVVNENLYDTTRFDTDKDAVHMTPAGHTNCTVCHHPADGDMPDATAQPCVPCHSEDPDHPTSFKWAAHDLNESGDGCRTCHAAQFSDNCAYCHPLLNDL